MTASSLQDGGVILHLGLGAFHRAHQAVYLQALHDLGDLRWVLVGTNIRPDANVLLHDLAAQGGSYTLETVSPAGEYAYQRIEAIRTVIPYCPDLGLVQACGADEATRIISFTVTEAGYHLDPFHRLDMNDPAIVADIARVREGGAGQTLYGAMAAILRARRRAGAGPVTLLNCDNLRHGGARFRAGLLAFIDAMGDWALHAWVQANTTCPNAMVDRITPRTPPELRERVREATGIDDPAPVTAERFIQWVIEDDFIAGRPDWQRVGVELVPSVLPYEEAKIRILNASHSCIAWAGTLMGLQYIHEGTAVPVIRQMVLDYVTQDVIPCLDRADMPNPVNLPRYRDVVLERFANPAICDTNQRVAADGFAKIPGFVAPTVAERLQAGASIEAVAMLPALFLAFLQRWHRGELPYVYQDQGMDPAVAHAICDAPDPVAALASDTGLWGTLAGDDRLVAALRRASLRVDTLVLETPA